MAFKSKQNGSLAVYEDIGILFIGPIIGLPPSLISTFGVLKKSGVEIEGVDIFEDQNIKKSLWNILRLTVLPGSHKRRVGFANNYNESHLFEIISNKINHLITQGKKKIILGGMSGGFIFASRITQVTPDPDVVPYVSKTQPFIKGLFGVSPLVFYPPEVLRKGSSLELIPPHIPTTLIWGDADSVIPKDTIAYSQKISSENKHIKCRVIRGSEVGRKDRSIRHQFFGGRDFVKPLTNIYWNEGAEKIALEEIIKIIETIK